ncbi:hypothetical protein ACA910_016937 [Epithemia clementina (nom. ined.)]
MKRKADKFTKNDNKKRRRGRKIGETSSSADADALQQATAGHIQVNSLLIKLSDDAPSWYKVAEQVPGRNATIVSDPPPEGITGNPIQLVEKYRKAGDELFRKEVQLFGKKGGSESSNNDKDMSWIQSTISKGTLKDRIAAMSVVVSTHPVQKFHALDGLLQMAGCLSEGQTNSRVAQLAAEALVDLFINTFLPKNRKLLTLAQRPLYTYEQQQPIAGNPKEGSKKSKSNAATTKLTLSPRVLLLWRFEEMVKDKYNLFLRQYIGYTLREGPEQQKIAALRLSSTLLCSVPEAEAMLLQMMTNKLGDPIKKVAAAAAHELRNVLHAHPAMQNVIAREVQQLAHRPHLSSRALYNCITFLNQLKFSKYDIPKQYTEKSKAEKDDGKNSKVAPPSKSLPASLISTYFRLFEVTVNNATKDADASAMKGRLLSALLSGVNRAHPFLPPKDREMEEHVDALYRVVHKAPPSACTQALLLLFHLAVGSKLSASESSDNATKASAAANTSKILSEEEQLRQERFYQTLYSRLARTELLQSGKHLTMLFNLIYKAMKYDRNRTRVIAFAKQVLSTTMHCPPPIPAATLFMLNEVAKFHPDLSECYSSSLEGVDAFRVLDFKSHDPQHAFLVKQKNGDDEPEQKTNNSVLAPLWEISVLLNHHHPSVANFAGKIGNLDYGGDPLKDFALAPFLDKFAYRNPKSSERIESKIDRTRKSVVARHSGVASLAQRKRALPFNDPSFLERKDVPVQDEFFHQFFLERAKRNNMRGASPKKQQPDEDEVEEHASAVDSIQEPKDHFVSFEQNWESDEEEERFVDHLAQKIIDDAINADELGPGDLDDEDPDMANWDDLHDDDDDDDDDDDESNDGVDTKERGTDDVFQGEDEENVDDSLEEDADDSEDSDDGPNVADDGDAFMDDDDSSSESGASDDELDGEEAFVLEDNDETAKGDGGIDSALVNSEDDDNSGYQEATSATNLKTKKQMKKAKDEPVFASADDYEDQIMEALKKIKRNAGTSMDEKPPSQSGRSKQKKKHKKKG